MDCAAKDQKKRSKAAERQHQRKRREPQTHPKKASEQLTTTEITLRITLQARLRLDQTWSSFTYAAMSQISIMVIDHIRDKCEER